VGKVFLPFADDRANKYIKYDANGVPQMVDQIAPGAVAFSAFGEALVVTPDADAAKVLLELPPAMVGDKSITVNHTTYTLSDLANELRTMTKDLGGFTLQVLVNPGNIDQPIEFSGFRNGIVYLYLTGTPGGVTHPMTNASYIRFENCDFIRTRNAGSLLMSSIVPTYGTGLQTQQLGYVTYLGCGVVQHQMIDMIMGNDVNAGTISEAAVYAAACQSVSMLVQDFKKAAASPAFQNELLVESCSTLSGQWTSSTDAALRCDVGLKASGVILSMSILPKGKVSDTDYGDGVVTTELVEKHEIALNELIIGHIRMYLTNWNTLTLAPEIAAGSSVEIGGVVYKFAANTVITAPPADGKAYLGFTASGATAIPAWTNTKPTWDATKNGWYVGAVRYSGHTLKKTGTTYNNKFWTLSHDRTFTVGTGPTGIALLDDIVAGAYIAIRSDAKVTIYGQLNYGLEKEFTCPYSGTYNITVNSWQYGGAKGNLKIYINGVDSGLGEKTVGSSTTSETIFTWTGTLTKGQKVQLYMKNSFNGTTATSTYAQNFRLKYGNELSDTTKSLLGFEV
jgi:hypothetical protein